MKIRKMACVAAACAAIALELDAVCAARQVPGEAEARIASVADGMCSVTNVAMLGTSGIMRVDFVLKSEPMSDIRCRLELPSAAKWDGRFWGVGNSGFAGKVPEIGHISRRGGAVATTDLGTSSVLGRSRLMDAWPIVIQHDFSWRATHLMTVYAKRMVAAFYGKAPDRSYFNGGSCGGRQAFSEAIRFPDEYDGIVAHLPANNVVANNFTKWLLWSSTHDSDGRLLFTEDEMRTVADAAVEYRASRDPRPYAGRFLADGRCTEAEVDAILSLAAQKAPSLRAGDKLARLKAIHMPFVADGECLSLGFAPGTYFGECMKRLPPARTWQEIRALARINGNWYNANDADLSPFFARGGKLIVLTGWEDQTVSPLPIVEHYERICAREGGLDRTLGHCRLFCAPGAAHGGGKGRATQGELGSAYARNALVEWVERGVAPDRIEVADRTRRTVFPVAVYPGLFVEDASSGWKRIELPRTKPRLADFIFDCDRAPLSAGQGQNAK